MSLYTSVQYRDVESPLRKRPTSPNQLRIAELNEKVRQIKSPKQASHQDELTIIIKIQERREAFQHQIRYVDERISKTEQQNDLKFNLLDEQLNKIESSLSQETFTIEVQIEKRNKELQLLEKGFSLSVHREHQEKKENESLMLRQIDDKITWMKEELYRDSRKREEYQEYRTREIVLRTNDLRQEFENEKRIRNEDADQIIRQLGDQVLRFQELLCQEKKSREDDHSKLLDILQHMNDTMNQDIEVERQKRENADQMLLKLLEETCIKIESTLLKEDETDQQNQD